MKALLSVVLLFTFSVVCWSYTPEEVIDIKKRAENGDAQAQHYLGVMYFTGEGVTKDFEEANKWSKKAPRKLFLYRTLVSYAVGKSSGMAWVTFPVAAHSTPR